jgi:hypothetical protein
MTRAQISNPSMTDVLLLLPGEVSRILARSESNPGPVKIAENIPAGRLACQFALHLTP